MNPIHIQQVHITDAAYQQVWQLREEILRQPLGLSLKDEDLSAEVHDIILAAFDGEQVIGCLILTHIDDAALKLRQMAVANNQQGKGIGRQLVQAAERVALEKGYKKIVLHAREVAQGFYKSMSYAIVGDEFTEVGVPHFKMEKSLK